MQYLKNLFQLILSPAKGWEDVSASVSSSESLVKDGFYPLLGIASLTEFVRLFYYGNGGFVTVLELAIALAGSYFISYYISRMLLEHYLKSHVGGDINPTKINIFSLYALGMLLIIEIIENVMPTDLNPLLPGFVCDGLHTGLAVFARKLRAFGAPDAVLTAPETRTSSPVRMTRGADLYSVSAQGLIPCGEGAGYAGGIMSAAVDGLRAAGRILSDFKPEFVE